MNVEIRIQHADLADALRSYVERRLQFSLGRFGKRLGRVTVRLKDLNGPRGGADKSCRIGAEIHPSARQVWLEAVDANLLCAIDRATERIGHTFGRMLHRERDRRYARDSIRAR